MKKSTKYICTEEEIMSEILDENKFPKKLTAYLYKSVVTEMFDYIIMQINPQKALLIN